VLFETIPLPPRADVGADIVEPPVGANGAVIASIRRTDVTEFWPMPHQSLRPDAGRPDYLAPLLSVVCKELAEVRRRSSQQRAAEIDQPCL
jgi:hypothetical protein